MPTQNEKPIIFKTEMVRAILDGRKTQTRRIIKIDSPTLEFDAVNPPWPTCEFSDGSGFNKVPCKYGQPGDRLWVRESFQYDKYPTGPLMSDERTVCVYRADVPYEMNCDKWKPSIHMPRWASRITLEITNVRVERLQDISEEDAQAEVISRQIAHGQELGWRNYLWHGDHGQYGLGNKKSDAWPWQYSTYKDAKGCFSSLWELINGPGAWDKNPWVWVIEFKKVTG